jgi:hypothetical protein
MNAALKLAGPLVIAAFAWCAGALTPTLAATEHGRGSAGLAAHGHAAAGGAARGQFAARSGFSYGAGMSHIARGGAFAARGAYGRGVYGRGGFVGRPGFGRGYWRGGYYGARFAWFLPILPAFFATYWFAGIPYYYANDAYYTWNPYYNGYVATDPPGAVYSNSEPETAPASYDSAPDAGGDIYLYPKNGQSDEQQSTDRYECHRWAAGQTGFDPTGGSGPPSSPGARADYRRAMGACLEGRGYSVK